MARDARLESSEHLRAAAVVGDVPLEPEDLESLAVTAYLTGRDGESTDPWTLAHQAWVDRAPTARDQPEAFLRTLRSALPDT